MKITDFKMGDIAYIFGGDRMNDTSRGYGKDNQF